MRSASVLPQVMAEENTGPARCGGTTMMVCRRRRLWGRRPGLSSAIASRR
jgi:hypothetical protein